MTGQVGRAQLCRKLARSKYIYINNTVTQMFQQPAKQCCEIKRPFTVRNLAVSRSAQKASRVSTRIYIPYLTLTEYFLIHIQWTYILASQLRYDFCREANFIFMIPRESSQFSILPILLNCSLKAKAIERIKLCANVDKMHLGPKS